MPNIARRPLTSAATGASCIVSRNRLRVTSLCEAFFWFLKVLGKFFGSPNGSQNQFFSKSFFDVLFACVLASISGRFCENWKKQLKKRGFIDFSGFGPPKIDQKSMLKRIQKNIENKTSTKLIWLLCWPPKTSPNLSKIKKERSAKRCWTEPVSKRYAHRAQVVATREKKTQPNAKRRAARRPHAAGNAAAKQKATHMIRSSPSIHPSIDLPLVALVINASPATLKASCRFLQERKNLKNPTETLPKPFQSLPKTAPKTKGKS